MSALYRKKRILCCWLVAITLMVAGLTVSLPDHAVRGGTASQGPEMGRYPRERVNSNDHGLPIKTTRRSLKDVHLPVAVSNDTELAAAAVSGSGAVDDPYVLGGWSISGSGFSGRGVYIYNTTKHVVIRDCLITGFFHGIFIDGVMAGTVTVANNTCISCVGSGIWLRDSPSTSVVNNTCQENGFGSLGRDNGGSGIWLLDSPSCTVTNNTCQENIFDGIWLFGSGSCTVTNNTCQSNDLSGIWLYYSPGSTAINNTCQENGEVGILVESSSSCTVVNNTCFENGLSGIWLHYSHATTVANNTCQEHSWEGINLYGSDSCTVTNNTCQGNNGAGINLWSSNTVMVANNTCQANGNGIVFKSSTVAAVNNTCRDNDRAGISTVDSVNANVTGNTFQGEGLTIQGDLATLLSLSVVNNRVNGQSIGFLTDQRGGTVTATHGQLLLVNCTDVVVEGQDCSATTRGIALHYSTDCAVRNSTCRDNSGEGIFISDCSSTAVNGTRLAHNSDGIYIRNAAGTLVTWNEFTGNRGHGVYLAGTASNTILHHNYFYNNSVQARDDGNDNQWYDGSTETGNSWPDHDPRTGAETYQVTGLAGATDPYPITDYDRDGIEDWYEYLMELDPVNASDAGGDKDGDGLDNLKEYLIGSWANSSDTDRDGMLDYYEYQNGLNLTRDDSGEDNDGDGLTNLEEFKLGTRADNIDTDGDGMPDQYESTAGLDPLVDDADGDFDNDTMINFWEYTHGLNVSNPADARGDPDGDWVRNVDEFRGKSDPFDFWSVPLFSFSVLHAVVFLVLVSFCTGSVAGLFYRKRRRKALVARFSAPDYATAVQIKKAGLPDHAAFLQAGEEARAVIQEGNACFHRGDLDGATRQYERALEAAERLGDDYLAAEAVFRIALVQKEQSTLATWSPVLERFPGRSKDMRVDIFDRMVRALVAETQQNWGTAKKGWRTALDAGGINAEYQAICQGALLESDVKNWLNDPASTAGEALLSRLEEWLATCRTDRLYSLSCRAYLLRARVTLASLQLEKAEESLNDCLTVAREHGLEKYVITARDELAIFSRQKEQLSGLLETAKTLTREEQEERLQAYIRMALKSLEKEE